MEEKKEFKKVNFEEYKDKFDKNFPKLMEEHPESINVETMRANLYGYTHTKEYADGWLDDCFEMKCWREKYFEDEDFMDRCDAAMGVNDDVDDFLKFLQEQPDKVDPYEVYTPQERLILQAIDSTGDGQSPETALCVVEVRQEYEYMNRVFPYNMLEVKMQRLVGNWIDCIEFNPNSFGIERLYFDVSRRYDVGLPRFSDNDNETPNPPKE